MCKLISYNILTQLDCLVDLFVQIIVKKNFVLILQQNLKKQTS